MARDTIAAIATPPGTGGIGVVRVSGSRAPEIARAVLGQMPAPRLATLSWFWDAEGLAIDQGIALFFPAPRSFTGEAVLELQGHGGPVVLDLLLQRLLQLGARLARPGEFSERAFLNGKLDLAQAEAIADLIASGTATAARLAGRTLRGTFSRQVEALVEQLIKLRTWIEAAMDFPEEEIDPLADSRVLADLAALMARIQEVQTTARQGSLVREGLDLVIAGPPNAGKSSLLNALSGTDTAIVTEIPGTTRDLLRQEIQIDGLPVHIFDTAGLRQAADPIEREGIRRARRRIEEADGVLWIFDDHLDPQHADFDPHLLPEPARVTFIRNKIDLTGTEPGFRATPDGAEIALSARSGAGIQALREHIKTLAGFREVTAGSFLARRRHLDALERTLAALQQAQATLAATGACALELVAEDLRQAQHALGEITGAFGPEDLLDRIFSGFCIGK